MEINKEKLSAYSNASYMVRTTKQVVMLYDGVIKLIQHAKQAIIDGNIEARFNNLSKAETIITGLQAVLDFDKGGEVAKSLYDYYSGLDSIISRLHREPKVESCDNIIENLRTMRDAWAEIDEKVVAGEIGEDGKVAEKKEYNFEQSSHSETEEFDTTVEKPREKEGEDSSGMINASAIAPPIIGESNAVCLSA